MATNTPLMDISLRKSPVAKWRADGLLFFAFEKEDLPPGMAAWMAESAPWAAESRALADFKAGEGRTTVLYGPSGAPAPRAVVAGLGPRKGFDMDRLRNAAAAGMQRMGELGLDKAGLPLAALEGLGPDLPETLEEALFGALAGTYAYDALKTGPEAGKRHPKALAVLSAKAPAARLRKAADRALAVAHGVFLARDLVNSPANVATPTYLADRAMELARQYGFKIEVLEAEAIRKLGMGAFAAVFQGSAEPPKFIVLEHAPAGTGRDKPLVFVGKGVTFDTGGISIKPSQGMEDMKGDMGGAAAVLGFFKAAGELGLGRRVVGILPCTDNMPDGRAVRPGDVVATHSGKTVEIINTDAEGRLLLCDALAYAGRYKPALVADLATLTGACVVALGTKVGASFSPDEDLARRVAELGKAKGEKLWPMPTWDMYFEDLKSSSADMRNVGPTRWGGAIHAAVFLKQFVPEGAAWVHLDIAGPAFTAKPWPTSREGGTGFGVRTLVELALRWPGI